MIVEQTVITTAAYLIGGLMFLWAARTYPKDLALFSDEKGPGTDALLALDETP
jgi:hypothetical protein